MKLAVITDSSAFLQAETLRKEDLFVLDIPVNIDGQEYVEGVNLTAQEFYEKMETKLLSKKMTKRRIQFILVVGRRLLLNEQEHVLEL